MDQEKDLFVDNREFLREVVFEFLELIVEIFPLTMVAKKTNQTIEFKNKTKDLFLLPLNPFRLQRSIEKIPEHKY